MIASLIKAVLKALLLNFIASWWAGRQKKKEIANAVAPYKAEADALASPVDSKHDNIVRLRDDIKS